MQWRDRLAALRFSHLDDFDRAIFDGVSAGYFDKDRLLKEAKALEETLNRNSRDNSFAQAWDRYHGSLTDDDDVVLDALRQGAMENLTTIDSININGTISFLREFGRNDQADELARAYTAAQPDHPRFFDLGYHHFSADAPVDPALKAAFEARQSEFKDERDPKAVLLAIGRGEPWQDEDVRLLAGVAADSFEAMIEGTEGKDLRLIVQTALQIAARHQEDEPSIKSTLDEAFARIAGKSPMRARRLRAWGYKAPAPDG